MRTHARRVSHLADPLLEIRENLEMFRIDRHQNETNVTGIVNIGYVSV